MKVHVAAFTIWHRKRLLIEIRKPDQEFRQRTKTVWVTTDKDTCAASGDLQSAHNPWAWGHRSTLTLRHLTFPSCYLFTDRTVILKFSKPLNHPIPGYNNSRLTISLRCSSPVSLTWVLLSDTVCRLISPLRCSSPVSVTRVPSSCSHTSFPNSFKYAASSSPNPHLPVPNTPEPDRTSITSMKKSSPKNSRAQSGADGLGIS